MHYIYIIQNQINLKLYIGQTKNPKYRWGRHKRASSLPSGHISKQAIHHAIEKHGVSNFTFQIIEECNDQQETNEAEVFWIEYFRSHDKSVGYNRAAGGIATPSSGYWKPGNVPWNKGTKNISKSNSGSFKETIKWPTDDELVQMTNGNTLTYVAAQLGVDISSISKRIKRRALICNISNVSSTEFKSGENHVRAKLTEQDVLEIVRLSKTSKQKELALKFNVSRLAISAILTGRNWSHITGLK